MVYSDSNGHGLLLRDFGFLQLLECESPSKAHPHVVTLSRTHHCRSQQTCCWSRRTCSHLGLSHTCTTLLAAWLVKPCSCTQHCPVVSPFEHTIDLPEVHIRNDMITFAR